MAEQERKPGKGKFKVVGQVAVVRVLDGSERYLYKGAAFDASQADGESVKHLVSVGLVEKVGERAPSAAEKATAAKAEADAKAKADAEAKEAEKAKAEVAEKAAAAEKATAAKGK